MIEKEYHPRLDPQNLQINKTKIILGSFPIWALSTSLGRSKSDNEALITSKNKEKEFPFFYGSVNNKFWIWYKAFQDNKISPRNVESIKNSLESNHIGITDVILSCQRKGKSSLDKHLFGRTYNHSFFFYPRLNETLKILCTSKGVMNEMLLCKVFFQTHVSLKVNHAQSEKFQNLFIDKIHGDPTIIRKPIFVELDVENGGKIQCMSIPSPGSPYRRLSDFGITEAKNLDIYLHEVFEWFKS